METSSAVTQPEETLNSTSNNARRPLTKKTKERLSDLSSKPVLWVLLFCLLGFVYHPSWINILLYIGNIDENVPMNYVSTFYLWTRSNKGDPEKIKIGSPGSFKSSNFRFKKTFVLIHGFTKNGLEKWITEMKDALLWREDCNVVSVDWDAGSMTASYYVIQARVPGVGEDVAKFVKFILSQTSLTNQDFHFIGHSLGAHISGFAGKALNGTVGRITGLDPAGLGFNGVAAPFRLDKTDAKFVDVIHTHGCFTIIGKWTDCYGTYDNIGDADFWPNGGESQPPCEEDGDGQSVVQVESNCNHGIVCVFFTQSVYHYATSTTFLARECSSYDHFNNGSCPCQETPQYMGFNANPSLSGTFYLNTTKFHPYGKFEPKCSAAQISFMKFLGVATSVYLILYFCLTSLSHTLGVDAESCLKYAKEFIAKRRKTEDKNL